MTHFLQQNRRLFSKLSSLLSVTSSILLVLGSLWAAAKGVALGTRLGDWAAFREEWMSTPSTLLLFIVFGLVARGMAQLLRYMHDPDYEPSWLLRRADMLLYLYAALFAARMGFTVIPEFARHPELRIHPWWAAINGVIVLLYVVAAVVVLVGVGMILKRLMPIIDEARTLAEVDTAMIRVRLSYLLLDHGMKLKELAETTGIALNNLSILKTNKARAIRFSTLEALCKALNCKPGELLEYVPDEGLAAPEVDSPDVGE